MYGTRFWIGFTSFAAAAAVGLAMAAMPAAAAPRVALQWDYGTDAPGAATSLRIRLAYRPADGSGGKAPAVDGLVVRTPAGAGFDPRGRPLCTADDSALRLLGRDACPAGSRLGGGTIAVDTGLGPPLDPMALELTAFATPAGLVELVQYPGSNLTLGFDRLHVRGEALTAHPPRTPGGPPDGRTTVRDIDLTLVAEGGYVRTPPTCPPGGWTATATAAFAGGGEETATDAVACRAPARTVRPRRCTKRTRGSRACRKKGRRAAPGT